MNTLQREIESVCNRIPLYHERFSLVSDILYDKDHLENKIVLLLEQYKTYINLQLKASDILLSILERLSILWIKNFEDEDDIIRQVKVIQNKDNENEINSLLLYIKENSDVINNIENIWFDVEEIKDKLYNTLTSDKDNEIFNRLLPLVTERTNTRSLTTMKHNHRNVYFKNIIKNIKLRYKNTENGEKEHSGTAAILDLWCGVGNMIQDLQEEIPYAQTYAIDKELIFHPRVQLSDDQRSTIFLQHDLEQWLPKELEGIKFDLIHAWYSPQYISNYPNLLPICYNRLKEKWSAIITLWHVNAVGRDRIEELKRLNKDSCALEVKEINDVYTVLLTKQKYEVEIKIPPYITEKGHDIRNWKKYGQLVYCLKLAAAA